MEIKISEETRAMIEALAAIDASYDAFISKAISLNDGGDSNWYVAEYDEATNEAYNAFMIEATKAVGHSIARWLRVENGAVTI